MKKYIQKNRHREKAVRPTRQSSNFSGLLRSRWSLAMTLLMLSIPLSGCVTREQADAKLARGCAAGAELFLPEGNSIKTINDTIFRDDPQLGKSFREVRLLVTETDGWYDAEQEYKCIFEETMGLFGATHAATLYKLHVHDRVLGKEGKDILGTFEEHLKLTETVEQGMNRP